MSRLNDLISKHCPRGVEFKKLSELGCTYGGLSGKSKSDFSNGTARFVSYKNIYNNLTVDLEAQDFVRVGPGEKQNTLKLGDVLFTGSSEILDEAGLSSVVIDEPSEPIYLNSFCFGYRFDTPVMLPEFAKYLFRSEAVRQSIALSASGVTRFNISKARFLNVRIPTPPLEIQLEIVKVLDTFSNLAEELGNGLGAELEARQRQYKYYRDELLTFDEGTTVASKGWTTLSEIGNFTRGRRFTNKDFVDSGVGCIHYGEIYTHYGLYASVTKSFLRPEQAAALRKAKTGDLVIAGTGESVEAIGKAVAWLGDEEVAVHDDCYIFSHSLNPKYMAYFFQSSLFNQQKVKHAAGAKMIRISSDGLGKIQIYVPPFEEQERIVSILDKFDALVNDLSSELQNEIKTRRQQYEYYRNRVLTFREAL